MDLWDVIRDPSQPAILGFGCMRFPVDPVNHKIDGSQAKKLIQMGMEAGIFYYDTAWPYHNGENEPFLGEALEGYPRQNYFLVTKLPCWKVENLDQARQILDQQLKRLHTDYFDAYLLHSLTKKTWEKMKRLGVPELLQEYRAQGILKHIGFSFHDRYEVFEEILCSQTWDLCQIQLNYMDEDYQAGLRGLELARSKGVPVVVMEPVKGGSLAKLPVEAAQPLREQNPDLSDAVWALRWVASQPGVRVVLSGMSDQNQLMENHQLFSPLRPLNQEERGAVEETARRLRQRLKNGCTGCRYCLPCPQGVEIPKVFQIWNSMGMYQNQRLTRRAWKGLEEAGRPEHCVGCGKCEALCPQQIPIRSHLAQAEADVTAFIHR